MRGAAVMLSGTGRDLAARPLPPMPPSVAALVTEVMAGANSSLQDLAVELVSEARTLAARATWAELGGGDAIGWLIAGLPRIGPAAAIPADPGSKLPEATDEQPTQAEQWALGELDAMLESSELLAEQAARQGTGVGDIAGAELLRFADEISVPALGRSSLAAELTLEAHEHRQESGAETGLFADGGWAGAAVGALGDASLGTAGTGMVGCLVVGGIGAGRAGDQVLGEAPE